MWWLPKTKTYDRHKNAGAPALTSNTISSSPEICPTLLTLIQLRHNMDALSYSRFLPAAVATSALYKPRGEAASFFFKEQKKSMGPLGKGEVSHVFYNHIYSLKLNGQVVI